MKKKQTFFDALPNVDLEFAASIFPITSVKSLSELTPEIIERLEVIQQQAIDGDLLQSSRIIQFVESLPSKFMGVDFL